MPFLISLPAALMGLVISLMISLGLMSDAARSARLDRRALPSCRKQVWSRASGLSGSAQVATANFVEKLSSTMSPHVATAMALCTLHAGEGDLGPGLERSTVTVWCKKELKSLPACLR